MKGAKGGRPIEALPEALLVALARRVQARWGLRPPRWYLLSRTAEMARASGRTAMDQVLCLLSGNGEAEVARLIEAMRVGETRFFRHISQMNLLFQRLLPEAHKRATLQNRQLKIWCAGCASGEEVYSVALILAGIQSAEGGPPKGPLPEVLGTDVSEAALELARTGHYVVQAGLGIPYGQRFVTQRILKEGSSQELEIRKDELSQFVSVRFVRHNLREPRTPSRFDVVLCRNVLIYFDEEGRRDVVQRLWESLLPQGILLIGSGETLPQEVSGLFVAGDVGGVYHLRPERGGGTPESSPPLKKVTPILTPAVVVLRGSYGDGVRLKEELRPHLKEGGSLIVDLDEASYLGNEDARVLRRAAELMELRLRAHTTKTRHWLVGQDLAHLGEGG